MASTDARPIPIKNTAFRAVFPILDADGDLVTGATGLDSEVSKDQGTFADCTNEATEIATNSGMYYLDLTSTEMNADCVAVIVKTTSSGAKTTVLVLYPEETGDINVDVTAFGGTAGTFSSGRPEVNTTHVAGTAQTAGDLKASLNTIDDFIDTEVAAILAAVDTEITAIDDLIDTEVAAIKTVVDSIETKVDTIDNFIDTEIQTIITMLTGIVPLNGTIGATGNSTTTLHLSGIAWGDDGPNSMLLLVQDVSGSIFVSRWIEDFATATDLATVATLPFTPEASVDKYWLIPVRADVTGGSGLDAAGVRAAIGLASANLDTQIGTLATAAALATVDDFLDTEIAAIKAKTDNLPAAPAATGDIPTAAAIADAVWDEDATAHQNAGTFGLAIGDPGASTETLYKAIVTDPAGTNIAADVIALKAETAAILTDTAEIGAAGAGLTALATQASVDTIDNFLDTEMADVRTRVLLALPAAAPAGAGGLGTVDASNFIAGIAGTKNQLDDLNDLSAAAVNAEADTAITDGKNAIATALLDLAAGVETGLTFRQYLRLSASALFGKGSGLETTTAAYRDFGDTKARITATVDADGNRTAITYDAT